MQIIRLFGLKVYVTYLFVNIFLYVLPQTIILMCTFQMSVV